MFVLLIPLLMLILVMVVDIGNIVDVRLSLNNINKLVISNGLDRLEEDDLKENLTKLIKENDSNIDSIEIEIEDGEITITLNCYSQSIFGNIVGLKGYDITSKYVGYLEDDQKVIKRLR
jgi:hypothetical protein